MANMRMDLIVAVVLLAGSVAAQREACSVGWAFPDGRECSWESPPITIIPEMDQIVVTVGVGNVVFVAPTPCPNRTPPPGVRNDQNLISGRYALICQPGEAVEVRIDNETALSLRHDGAGWRIERTPGPPQ